ncbi:MAG: 1-acyl-sn-glycerol-3-phosphate acyltransferase, partial [Holophagales bacterium]|nr:1-acyl-sn-glycerol-3-phosphate acyltransferase [Holophagales bacterium]
MSWGSAFVTRSVFRFARRSLASIRGLENVAPERDPFVLVANHSQRLEAVYVPSFLFVFRGGKRVHFLADWPMMLVPGVATLYRVAQVVPVFGKEPKIRALARLRPFYQRRYPGSAWDRAGQLLAEGGSIGAFPEGTINRRPDRLLRGRTGAARLAVESRVPVVPVGIRFPEHGGAHPIADGERMEIEIGEPLEPPPLTPSVADGSRAAVSDVRAFHHRI